MKRTPTKIDLLIFPDEVRPFAERAPIFDSSSSPDATVLYVEKDGGLFIKIADKGALQTEFRMTRYFRSLGLGADVLGYVSKDRDYLITTKVDGRDGIDPSNIRRPEPLCDAFAQALRYLHSLDHTDCPIRDHTEKYLATATRNYRNGKFDASLSPEYGYASAAQAWDVVQRNLHKLQADTLLHGDYCLPNVLFCDDLSLGGFIDVGCGGVGDRHVDIFWGLWTLKHNLKTGAYRRRFIEAYGRDRVDEEMLRLIAAVETFG